MPTGPSLRTPFVILGALCGLCLTAGCEADVASTPRPVAVVGSDQVVTLGETATLDGSASHEPGDPQANLTYRWTLVSAPAGNTAALGGAATKTATLKPSASGLYVAGLVVTYNGVASDPAYVDVATYEKPRPPLADAGGNQAVDPGATVTLDGSASADPNGSPLTYAWSYISGPPNAPQVTLSSSSVVKPTFTAPGPPGDYHFTLTVTDGYQLTSKATTTVTVNDVPPVAVITGSNQVGEGETATLIGSTSYDPNGATQPISGYSWAMVSTSPKITLQNPTSATAHFVAPSICGAKTATVSLVVTAGGKTSAPTTKTIQLLDTINDPPTAVAKGPTTPVDEGSTVHLDGTASSDCNGDKITYHWAQAAGQTPAVTLINPNTATPSFVAPTVYQNGVTLSFILTVTDTGGLTDQALVDVTENNTIDEPPVAVATAQSPVTVQQTKVKLDGSGSHDPDPADTLTYTWTQTSGTTVTLSSDTAASPTFTAPSTPGTLAFKLVVSDGTLTDTATASVVVNPGPPDPTQSTITASPTTLVADGTSHSAITVLLRDAAGNPLDGKTVVISTTLGSLAGSVTNTSGGRYTQSLVAGIVVGTATVSFTVGGSPTFPSIVQLALVAGPPAGTIALKATPATLAAGCGTTTISTSLPIKDQYNNPVKDGTEITVSADAGAITTADADPGTLGLQVLTQGGNISFTLQAPASPTTVHVTATSVTGSATNAGSPLAVPVVSPEPQGPVTLTANPTPLTVVGTTATGPTQTTITSSVILDTCGNQVAPGTVIPLQITLGTLPGGNQATVNASGQISFTAVAGQTAGTMVVEADNGSGTTLGTVPVPVQPGPAVGTIVLNATPGSIAADGTSTTQVVSQQISDVHGNPIPDGTPVPITVSSPACTVTSPQLASGGVISFHVGPCTAVGTVTVGASVDAATGSTTFDVTAGPAAKLQFDVQPANTFVGGEFPATVKVSVRDTYGNVTSSTAPVTMALGNAAGATLGGTLTVNAVAGIASFPDLTVDKTGTGYTLLATSAGLTGATSNPFNVATCNFTASLTATGPVPGTTHVLPWDTVVLDPTGSSTCNRQITVDFTTNVSASPGGFQPWGSFPAQLTEGPTKIASAVSFFTDTAHTYIFTLTIHDDTNNSVHQATATITVEGFTALNYGSAPATDTWGLALDPNNGNVLIATQGQKAQIFHYGGSVRTLPCLSNDSNARGPVFDGSDFWVGYADGPEIDQITGYATSGNGTDSCSKHTVAPQATSGTNPSATRDMTLAVGTVYAATNRDVFGIDPVSRNTTEYDFSGFGSDQDYSTVKLDTTGQLWVASNTTNDGALRTALPPVANATVNSYIAGNDKIRCAVGLQTPSGSANFVILGTDGNGYIIIPHVTQPGTGTVTTATGSPSNYDNVRGAAYDADAHDAWFATKGGLVRYKQDLQTFALIPQGDANLPNIGGDSHAVLLDEGSSRGRILYYGTGTGVVSATAP